MEDTAKVPMDGKPEFATEAKLPAPEFAADAKLPAPEIATDVLKRKRSLGCRICCRVCALVSVAIFGYLLYTGVHFGLTFSRGMAYMREEESHLVNTTLTLNGKALQWYKVNDVVMGGHSTSTLEATEEGGLRFSGVISTQDGGFASCSTLEQPLALPPTTTGFEMTVTGNWELYKFSVKTDKSVWVPIWQADLPSITYEEPGVKHTFTLPLTAFSANRMGRPMTGYTLNATEIVAIGFNLALVDVDGSPNPHFAAGPFALTLHDVRAVSG